MWTSSWQGSEKCDSSHSVSLFVSNSLSFHLHLTNFSFWSFHLWIQRWRIDTRNSFKLSSETCWIDANVLEERTSTTSCILAFCFLFLFLHITHCLDSLSSFTFQFISEYFPLFLNTLRILKRFVQCCSKLENLRVLHLFHSIQHFYPRSFLTNNTFRVW
jgi:hypothetical protein